MVAGRELGGERVGVPVGGELLVEIEVEEDTEMSPGAAVTLTGKPKLTELVADVCRAIGSPNNTPPTPLPPPPLLLLTRFESLGARNGIPSSADM